MSDDPTNNLRSGDKLDQLIRLVQSVDQRLQRVESRLDRLETRLENVETRLNDLETKVDERLKETRPIWEAVLSQLQQLDARINKLSDDLSSGLRKVERKIEILNDNFLRLAGDQRDLLLRVEDLESKAS
jgi:chromosome segregation ATPase